MKPELRDFEEKPVCSACECKELRWRYHADGELADPFLQGACAEVKRQKTGWPKGDHICLTCTRCKYSWAMRCKAAKKADEA